MVRAFPLAMPHLVQVMIPVVVSPAVFCGARAGSKILTHTPISLFKQLFGKKFVILLVNQTGKPKRDMPSRRNALTS